jgi:ribosome-binding protein aMBF1 (putative translation factor)
MTELKYKPVPHAPKAFIAKARTRKERSDQGLTATPSLSLHLWPKDFGTRLAILRKQRTMTQQTLADAVACHATMIRRYESNKTQPTLEVSASKARGP